LLLIAVIGIGLSAFMMTVYSAPSNDARIERTALRLAEAREALIGFSAHNGRLPRPAISAVDGRENPNPCTDGASCTGFLPWVTLGVEGEDSWGKRLRYSVSPAFTNKPILGFGVVADKVVVGRTPQSLFYYQVGQARCDASSPCAPAVIYSNGKNNLGYSNMGVHMANAEDGNIDEQYNDSTINNFINRRRETNAGSTGGQFDDQVLALPLQPVLRAAAVGGASN
jgi:type II secretory pathway pseudopilin PulG